MDRLKMETADSLLGMRSRLEGQRRRAGGWITTKKIMYLVVDKREIEVTQSWDLQGREEWFIERRIDESLIFW